MDDLKKKDKGRLLLEDARVAWESLRDFRARRKRSRNFLRGKQWVDLVYDHKEKQYVTEEQYLIKRGRLTSKNNHISPMFRNLVGQFRTNHPSPVVVARKREDATYAEALTEKLRTILDLNAVSELDTAAFREMIMSGLVVQRVAYDYWRELRRREVLITNINPTRFFFNTDAQDPRGFDIVMCGEIMDAGIDDVVTALAKTKKEAERIRKIYGGLVYKGPEYDQSRGEKIVDSTDFYVPKSGTMVRLYEIWRVEHKWTAMLFDPAEADYAPTDLNQDDVDQLNRLRIEQAATFGIPEDEVELYELDEEYLPYTHVYWLAPTGEIISEMENPFDHQLFPYVIKAHPMIDGEMWGLIEDVIDQQKYINRFVSMLDFLVTSSAKGVLMVPKDVVPEEMNPDDFADKFIEGDSVIFYTPKPHNKIPQHIVNNSVPAGLIEMLREQPQMMEKISGVLGPVAGHTPNSNTPASLYAQQVANATTTNKDIFDGFYSFLKDRNKLCIQLAQQFYYGEDDAKISHMEYDVNLSEGVHTAVYRQMIDQYLMEFLTSGLISFEDYLEETSLPFADNLLNRIRMKREQSQAQGLPAGASPDVTDALPEAILEDYE